MKLNKARLNHAKPSLKFYGQVRSVVFKLCAAAPWGAIRNLKGAVIFFSTRRNFKVFLPEFAWRCREIFLVSFRVPRAK